MGEHAMTSAAGSEATVRDRAAIATMPRVVRVFVNPSHWWQNASFALPLAITVIALAGGWLLGSTEAKGFGIFAAVVTIIMIPVVLLTWRGTATSIVLTEDGAVALHEGKTLHALEWNALRRIEVVEYLGNTRYKLVHGEAEFLTVESDIEDAAALVDLAFSLSGVPRQAEAGS